MIATRSSIKTWSASCMISTCGVLMRLDGSQVVMKMKSSVSILSKGNLRRLSSPISRRILGGTDGHGAPRENPLTRTTRLPGIFLRISVIISVRVGTISSSGLSCFFIIGPTSIASFGNSPLRMINLCMQGCGSNKKEISVIAADIHVGCNSRTVSPCSTWTIFPYV